MQNQDYQKTWETIRNKVSTYSEVESAQAKAFFSRLQLQAFSEEGFIMLTADNEFIRNWIEQHYTDILHKALMDLYSVPFTISIEVDTSIPAVKETEVQSTAFVPPITPAAPVAQPIKNPTQSTTAPEPNPDQPQQFGKITNETSKLTFQNYVIGNSNRIAYAMALNVAEHPGDSHLNPLFIYGKSGVGKTHLLRAIQNHINEMFNSSGAENLKTIYVDTNEFVEDYANASADHTKEKTAFKSFKKRYEDADILLIDDVQILQGKKQTVDIVFQIFNTFIDHGKQVVLSADIAPKNIDLDERYISRFNSGGTFDIQAPEVETKIGIIKSFLKEFENTSGPIEPPISPEIISYISSHSSNNIRELKSAITLILAQMKVTGQSLEVEDVERLLENHFSGGINKRLTIADIQKGVETFYKVNHADLIGKSRKRNIVYARQVAMYLCRVMLNEAPFNIIGEAFGGKDHSTVIYSVDIIEAKVKESKEVHDEIEIIKQEIIEG